MYRDRLETTKRNIKREREKASRKLKPSSTHQHPEAVEPEVTGVDIGDPPDTLDQQIKQTPL